MSEIRVNTFKAEDGISAPSFPNGIQVTGIVTSTVLDNTVPGDLTVTGNVSVGGTLTYEDVTNIDSVGLVTARTGVKVPAGEVTVGNNIQLGNAGIVTATTFSGSGASLTSIPAGQLTGTVADARISTLTASKLSGALPAISGANLTNLDASDLASGTIPDARFPATLPAVSGANLTGMSAGLQSMNVYTTPGTATWTKPSGITKVKVIVTGGGGGCSAVGGNRADDIGAGGAAGGTAMKIIDVSSISSVTVTVGMGGTATPYNYNENVDTSFNGNEGQPSSFGSHCSATGGNGGRSYYTNNGNVTGHAIPGVGSGGDINIRGGYGDLPTLNMPGPPQGLPGGLGGVSFWGGPGRAAMDDNFTGGSHDISGGASTGSSAGAYGSGGSAGSRNFTGGAGTHGVVVVENYA